VSRVEDVAPRHADAPSVLPGWVKLAYGAGAGGWTLVDRVVITWLYYWYVTTPLAGVDALLAPLAFSLVMLGGRVVDALADPVIARRSDNHAGPRGRRVPFLLVSAVPYVAVYVALFYPPVAGRSPWNAVYLGIVLSVYFVLFTAYVGPYLALLADLSSTNRDRVDLSTSKAVATLLGAGVALIVSGLLVEAFGLRAMVWILGAVGLALLLVPTRIPERRFATAEPATMPLLEAVRTTLSNRPFLIALVGANAFWFGFNIVTLNVPLYATRLMGQSEGAVALLMGAVFGVCLLAFPVVNVLAKRLGLKAVMVASLVLFAAVFPLLYLLPDPPFGLPVMGFGLGVMALAGIPLAGFFIVPDAIIAAVADLERSISGQRREGMYFGVNGLLLKINLGISTVVSGALLQFAGDPRGIQLTGPVAAVAVALGALVFTRYPERDVEAGRAAPDRMPA
jgi:glycoside/pentoside/hexuronide:cation symporter, GPH family